MKKLLIALFVAMGVASCHTPPTPEPTYERKYDPWRSFVNAYVDVKGIKYFYEQTNKAGRKYITVRCDVERVSAEREDMLRELYNDLTYDTVVDGRKVHSTTYPYLLCTIARPDIKITLYCNRDYTINHLTKPESKTFPAGAPLDSAVYFLAGSYYKYVQGKYEGFELNLNLLGSHYWYHAPATRSDEDEKYAAVINWFNPFFMFSDDDKKMMSPLFHFFFPDNALPHLKGDYTFTVAVEYCGKKFTKSLDITF